MIADPAKALEHAIESASPNDAVFATGSLYLVGDLRAYWATRPLPQSPKPGRPIVSR